MKEASAKYLAHPGYKQTEVGVIPEDWVCPTVAQVAANRSNAIVGGPFGSDLVSKDYVATGIPVVRGQNMARKYVSGDFVFVSESKAKHLQANMARVDDIIFTQRGTLGQVSVVPSKPFEKYLVSQSQMKLTLNSDVASSLFVYQYFISANGQRQILNSSIQTGVPHTNLGILRSYRIPLPPTKAEQQAIAEALSEAEALIESLEQLLAKKRQVKQGAMQELLTGKKRLPGFGKAWSVVRLRDLLFYERPDKHMVRSTEYITHGDTPVLTANKSFILGYTSEGFGICRDVPLIVFDDFTTASKYVNFPFKVKSSAIKLLRPRSDQVDLRFVFDRMQLIRFTMGDHKRYYISEFQQLEVAVPDIAEQQAISLALSEAGAEIAALESKLVKARQVKQGMMQELLSGRIRLV